jgi:sirohydrochlorin ferrochelatase
MKLVIQGRKMMRALLLVSHGSRRTQSNEEVNQVCEQLKEELGESFDIIDSVFLEIASPSIPEGIKRCVVAGSSSVTILPYFLAAGRHVTEDIPAIVADASEKYPGVSISLTRHIGASEGMLKLISSIIRQG